MAKGNREYATIALKDGDDVLAGRETLASLCEEQGAAWQAVAKTPAYRRYVAIGERIEAEARKIVDDTGACPTGMMVDKASRKWGAVQVTFKPLSVGVSKRRTI